ncbi:MAG: aspartate/glutamate racemase family protein [Rhizobiaceae bacterium]
MEAIIKKIGLIGGIGWPATLTYYEGICKASRTVMSAGSPPMVIESLNMEETLSARGRSGDEESWQLFDSIFIDAMHRLEQAGCAIAAMASVTPHARLSSIRRGVNIPIISIVDICTDIANRNDIRSAIVLGTPVTMSGGWFDHELKRAGIAVPISISQADIDATENLLSRYFYPGDGFEGRAALLKFCSDLNNWTDKAAIVLACTDFSSAFPEFEGKPIFTVDGQVFIDAASAHIQAILKSACEK